MSTTIWVRNGGAGSHSGIDLDNAKSLPEAINYLNALPTLADDLIFNMYGPFGTHFVMTVPLSQVVVNGNSLGRVWWRGVDINGIDAICYVQPSSIQNNYIWSSAGVIQNHVWQNIVITSQVNTTPATNAPWLFSNGTKNCLFIECRSLFSKTGFNLGFGSNANSSGVLVRCTTDAADDNGIVCSNVCEVSTIECYSSASTTGFLNVFFVDRCFAYGCPTSFKGCRVLTSCTSDTGQTAAYHASSTAMQFVLDGIATQTPIGLLGDTGNNEQVPVTLRRFGQYAVTTRTSQPDGGYLSDNSGLTATNSPFEDIGGFDYDLNNDPAGGGTMYGTGVSIGDGSVSYHDSGISQHPCQAGNATTVFTGTVLNRGVN